VITSSAEADDDEPSLEERFQELCLSDAKGIVRLVIKGFFGVLLLGSILLTILGISGSLTGPIAVRVTLYVLSAFFALPAILQFIDWSRKPDSPNPLTIDRLTEGIGGHLLRRKQTRFITLYGRQEMARRLWPDEADSFSVAHQMKIGHRRKKRWLIGIAIAVVAATAGGVTLFAISQSSVLLQVQSVVGRKFHIDDTFAMTVLNASRCSRSICSVEIRFRNVSDYTANIGPGSFIAPEYAAGTTLCNPFPPADCVGNPVSGETYYYIISLVGNNRHYDSSTITFNGNQLLAGQATQAEFMFEVPPKAPIQELMLSGVFGRAIVRFSNS
jgi:hypothetical protein